MTLAISGTSPARVNSPELNAYTDTLTTAAFTPPGGSIIIVEAEASQWSQTPWLPASITDSLGSHLTWSSPITATTLTDIDAGGAWVFWAYAGDISPGSMTVSVTLDCTNGSSFYLYYTSMTARVWTGAKTSGPIGANDHNEAFITTLTVPLTPTAIGAALCMASVVGMQSGTPAAAAGTNTYAENELSVQWEDYISSWYGDGSGPFLTTDLSSRSQVLGTTNSDGPLWQYVAYEVLPAAGGAASKTLSDAGRGVDGISNDGTLGVPANLRSPANTDLSADLAWDAAAAATGYEVLIIDLGT